MKLILSLLIVLASSSVVSTAATLSHYFTGVWYSTKAPHIDERTSGQLNIFLYDDGTVRSDAYFNGSLLVSGVGSWRELNFLGHRLAVDFSLNTPIVHRYKGTIKRKFPLRDNFFGAGTYKGATGYNGRWQVTGSEQ